MLQSPKRNRGCKGAHDLLCRSAARVTTRGVFDSRQRVVGNLFRQDEAFSRVNSTRKNGSGRATIKSTRNESRV